MAVIRSVVLPNQKRSIVAAIIEAGLTASDFEWSDVASEHLGDDETALMIKHRHKNYYFCIDRTKTDSWSIEFCPASKTEWTKSANVYWDHVVNYAKTWATRVAAELEDEDYVELATGSPQLLNLPSVDDDTHPLTVQERDLLIQRLDEIEKYVLDFRGGSVEFENQVRASLRFLKEHARQSDRRSFYALVFSTLLAIGLTFLNPAETKQVIQHANTKLNIEVRTTTKVITVVSND